uniref:Uncharacterized protein n=1 Tax=Haptolina brevifila TaxID=156173 RepID=A0A7S2GFY2_9EUKA|mmetsp:Transcript_36615/g.72965  ORF Transcript_36615/g.72965 Transcript_36615/m.72965 type:complete len:180 (+) Transcript_36615:49-588(+)|eukprot:CAMPEP_0174760062 /NCGR_PEP_ID=MMETSP1094-20130205/108586_1 /TAXON_ID=156173 /ORGANISM="Chrysochromulina brevifilum, Strain UTEX LB 985" /LENGTH=179 /DNA_ID=CAMNT_0015966003 /DNA_START=146 /DNA_END=685 /DNA_ORIENTATION=-
MPQVNAGRPDSMRTPFYRGLTTGALLRALDESQGRRQLRSAQEREAAQFQAAAGSSTQAVAPSPFPSPALPVGMPARAPQLNAPARPPSAVWKRVFEACTPLKLSELDGSAGVPQYCTRDGLLEYNRALLPTQALTAHQRQDVDHLRWVLRSEMEAQHMHSFQWNPVDPPPRKQRYRKQ